MQDERRLAWRLIGAWALVGLLLAFISKPLSGAIWILTGVVVAVYLLAGVALFVILIVETLGRGKRAWQPILGLPLAGVFLWLAWGQVASLGDEAQFRLRFGTHEADYVRLSQLAQREQPMPPARAGDVAYELDGASPTRVAFPLPGGITDNWEAVIFDPTDEVGTAKGWGRQPGDFTASPAAKKLFGGDLLACRRVKGHFYRCRFT